MAMGLPKMGGGASGERGQLSAITTPSWRDDIDEQKKKKKKKKKDRDVVISLHNYLINT